MKAFADELEKIARALAPSPKFLRALAQEQDEEEARDILKSQRPAAAVKAVAAGMLAGSTMPLYMQAVGSNPSALDVEKRLRQIRMEAYVQDAFGGSLGDDLAKVTAKEVLNLGLEQRGREGTEAVLNSIRAAGGESVGKVRDMATAEGMERALEWAAERGGLPPVAVPPQPHRWLPTEQQILRAVDSGDGILRAAGKAPNASKVWRELFAERFASRLPQVLPLALAGGLGGYALHRRNQKRVKKLIRRAEREP